MMPEWIVHTPAFTQRSGMRRTVTTIKLRHSSTMSKLKGHQWNHSNSVISNAGSCRTSGTALPIEQYKNKTMASDIPNQTLLKGLSTKRLKG
jgi:hypothetical protein